MYLKFFVCLCILHEILAVEVEHSSYNNRESRKLFGGYRITPRYCKPTRKPKQPMGGPTICMFNHECSQRNGEVVGACMDGFLFGTCCQLPTGSVGELVESEQQKISNIDNSINTRPIMASTYRPVSSTTVSSAGLSQISLISPGIVPTAQDNIMVQVNHDQVQFSTTGVTHTPPDTYLINDFNNEIYASDFRPSTKAPIDNRKTTMRSEETTIPYSASTPMVHISVSNAPSIYASSHNRPGFRPKPSKPSDTDKYVLVPTISHSVNKKPNKTQEYDTVINILSLYNETSSKNPYYEQFYTTSKRPPSTSYLYSASPTRRPVISHNQQTTTRKPPSTSYVFSTTIPPKRPQDDLITSRKPPSTSYVYSSTIPPRRTAQTTKKRPSIQTTRKPGAKPGTKPGIKPTKPSNNKKPTTYTYPQTTFRPIGHSTFANTPGAFFTTKPPSTSYVYSSKPTRRPPATVNSHIAGPGFTVTANPSVYSTNDAPSIIVLNPLTGEDVTKKPVQPQYSTFSTYQSVAPTTPPPRKPINHVTINNHITQNIFSTSSERPSPTVLITPKPTISSSFRPTEYITMPIEVETSADDLINFPPVRNPNLNMSIPVLTDSDITTPAFIEDDALDDKVESFVNNIIQGLQEPFEGLKDVVYNKNKTNFNSINSTTKKPLKKQGTSTKKPSRTTTVRTTTRKTPTKKPSNVSTRKPSTTTKKSKPTKKVTTTTESFIEQDEETSTTADSQDYRSQCGIRPLIKTGRIVGGKGATFGEFPWQVLVRESTWLGLFTKNKCGGVLIGNKYVMTAAHCQPGFLASLVAVFGEFDISGELESKRSISRNVKRVIVHRQYDAATFENDLALLELESPVQFDSHIVPICLPRGDEDFTGRMATVTGWGRLKYGGGVPSVLQEVQVPIMENHVCQEMFRTAGHSKVILDSFLCAGYANGQKDSCEGDSGGPLVLQRPDGRYQLAGTVSHGIKCAAPYLPGVYMRTMYYKPWIESITNIH